jgi:hypothetical protein
MLHITAGVKSRAALAFLKPKNSKSLKKKKTRLRRALSDLTLDKLILKEAAQGSYLACKLSPLLLPAHCVEEKFRIHLL